MMIDLIKRVFLLVFVPFQVAKMQEADNAARCPPWVDPADDYGGGGECWENDSEYEEGFDLYGMGDDNCSFDLFEDDETGWNEEDGF